MQLMGAFYHHNRYCTRNAQSKFWGVSLIILFIAAVSTLIAGLQAQPVKAADLDPRDLLVIRDIRAKDEASARVLSEKEIKTAVPLKMPELTPQALERMGLGNIRPGPMPGDDSSTAPNIDPSAPFQAQAVEDPSNQRPFWNVGKLVFKTHTGEVSWCSAQFVGSTRVLMTALHCILDAATGERFTNLTFLQAYDNGNYSKKTGIECVAVYEEAFRQFGLAYDYAFLYTEEESQASHLDLRIGMPFREFSAVGYPINLGSAERMFVDPSATSPYQDENFADRGWVVIVGNQMARGSSGGAWIAAPRERPLDVSNIAIGLNAWGLPGFIIGPYFDANTEELLAHVKSGGCLS